ncbi:unnamed protein product [Toxocara canis]|uniref:Uncharacterized protein n=1 Tax=Toxocara canis TaxID=6265 RepID=A0A183UC49_TOXCA|nr:unnamed protein product [Toxocara canis]
MVSVVGGSNESDNEQYTFSNLSLPREVRRSESEAQQTPEHSEVHYSTDLETRLVSETNSTIVEQINFVTLSDLQLTSPSNEELDEENETSTADSITEVTLPLDERKVAVLVEKVGDNFTESNITVDAVQLSNVVIDNGEESKILTKHSSINLKLSVISLAVVGAFLFLLYSYCLY